jgi:hypothetical protein
MVNAMKIHSNVNVMMAGKEKTVHKKYAPETVTATVLVQNQDVIVIKIGLVKVVIPKDANLIVWIEENAYQVFVTVIKDTLVKDVLIHRVQMNAKVMENVETLLVFVI